MSFPTTSVVDNFNRANEGPPPSASWKAVDDLWGGMKVVSNGCKAGTGNSINGAVLTTAASSADSEAYMTISTKPGTGSSAGVLLRGKDMTGSGAVAPDGYEIEWSDDDGNGTVETIAVYRMDNGSFTKLGASISRTCSNGYKLGASMAGSTIEVFTDEGAGWTSRGTRTDSTYTAAGYYGIQFYEGTASPTAVADDFGGGAIVAGGTSYTQDVSGALTSSGVLIRQMSKLLAGSLTDSGALSKSTSKAFSGLLSSSGSDTKQAGKAFAGSLSSSGSLIKTSLKALSGALTSSGGLVRDSFKVVSGALTSSGTLLRSISRSLSGTLTSSGDLSKQTAKDFSGTLTSFGVLVAIKTALLSLAGAISFSGALTKQSSKVVEGNLASSGSLVRDISKALSGALLGAGSLIKQTAKTFSGSLTSSGTLSALKAALISLGGAISFSGSITKQVGKSLTGTLTSSGTINKLIGYVVTGSLTSGGAVVKKTSRFFTGAISSSGSLVAQFISGVGGFLGEVLAKGMFHGMFRKKR